MGDSYTQPNLIRGTNNTNNSDTSGIAPSRLLRTTNSLRNDLTTRNLYTPINEYPLAETGAQNLVNAVNSIASLVAPFKSFNLENTVFGRVVGTQTPLTAIGTAMLGKQLAYNAGSSIAQEFFPTIKVANLFDGNKNTKLFTANVDFKITKKRGTTAFQTFLDAAVYYYPANDYPFTKNPTNGDFIENSGTGQLTFLFRAMNQNIYKQGFGNRWTDVALEKYSNIADFPITDRHDIVFGENSRYREYFNFFFNNPYSNISISHRGDESSYVLSNYDTMFSYSFPAPNSDSTQEYAPSKDFVDTNFGSPKFVIDDAMISYSQNVSVSETNEFKTNNVINLVWGRDGRSKMVDQNNGDLRGNTTNVITALSEDNNIRTTFNIYSGLLEYTKNLLNASEGNVVDLTRKAFKNKQIVSGYNGSAIWVSPKTDKSGGSYAAKSGIPSNSTGIRQHSILDQYDRFAKTIRYVGNIAYNSKDGKTGGNENSVIYNTVLPRIHPIVNEIDRKDGYVNNRNLMFSIENLAVRVIGNAGNLDYGIIDDEYGTIIPASEVGQFNGRLMWFPPYDISISESTAAKYESTVMIGRSEPMYNYMNSERSATLSFTLLVDYPEQLKNSMYTDKGGNDKHRKIAEFFAFGGDPYTQLPYVINPDKTIKEKEKQKEELETPTPSEFTEVPTKYIMTYFYNDYPTLGAVRSAFDVMYKDGYQVKDKLRLKSGFITNGVAGESGNGDVYVNTAMVGVTNAPTNSERYLHVEESLAESQYQNDWEDNELNKALRAVFDNKANWKYYNINITGAASKLYFDKKEEKDYNEKLGKRRADAAAYLVEQRLKKIYGRPLSDLLADSVINTKSISSDEALISYADFDKLPLSGQTAFLESPLAVAERNAEIEIIWTGNKPPVTEAPKNINDAKAVEQTNKDISALNELKNNSRLSDGTFNERGDGDAIMGSFKSISGNKLYPTFHSQTPEDFHRRLTFLQQCMRQGAAIRYDNKDTDGNLTAKNSVFGRQPICILRYGDFMFTKVVIENLTIDYTDVPWDMNPEGMGMQPMMAKITLQMKIIGGQSLKGPIDALQNAVSFNHYANSNFKDNDGSVYSRASEDAENQFSYINGVLTKETDALTKTYEDNLKIKDSK